jgi:hypothetical protein
MNPSSDDQPLNHQVKVVGLVVGIKCIKLPLRAPSLRDASAGCFVSPRLRNTAQRSTNRYGRGCCGSW